MNKEELIDLVRDAGYGVLATADGDAPKARPMMPYLSDEGNLMIATFKQKRVVSQVKANPKVEMCFIDRRMNFARISGQATVTDDQAKKELVWNSVPMLKQYFASPDDPDFIIIEIDTDKVEAMCPQDTEPEILSLK